MRLDQQEKRIREYDVTHVDEDEKDVGRGGSAKRQRCLSGLSRVDQTKDEDMKEVHKWQWKMHRLTEALVLKTFDY